MPRTVKHISLKVRGSFDVLLQENYFHYCAISLLSDSRTQFIRRMTFKRKAKEGAFSPHCQCPNSLKYALCFVMLTNGMQVTSFQNRRSSTTPIAPDYNVHGIQTLGM